MMSHVMRPAAAAVTLVFALALVACGGGGGNTVNTDITGVTVSPSALSLAVGGAAGTLTATVQPAAAPNKAVNWSSSNENVARVEKTDATHASVTAVSGGSATITVTTEVGGKTNTCPVTVTVPVTGLSLPKNLSLFVGESKPLAATLMPTNATNQAVTWGSGAPAIVTVTGSGPTATVSGATVGTSRITATSQGNPSATDYCDIIVAPVLVTGVSLGPTLLKLAPAGTGTLSAVISPANATDKTLEWTSNTDAVTVTASGTTATVRAVTPGTATITVRSTNGFTATSTIVVAAAQAPGTFVAGSFGLLKNGAFAMDNGTRLNAVYVDTQNNVHATGRDSTNQAVYVWNGVSIVLPRDQWATAAEGNSICVDDGHVYIAGRQSSDSRTQAKLWVDGANRPLTNVGNYNYSDATSVFAGTVSVPLAGSQFVLVAGGVVGTSSDAVKGAAWYGDTLITDIQAANGYVRSVTIANPNLYVGGDFGLLYISLINLALGNYTPSIQNDASGAPYGPVNAIFTVGNDVHAVGYSGPDAVYYNSSRVKTVLSRNALRAYARATGICVSEYGTVYVAGYDWNTENDVVAVLWTNGARQELDAPKKYNAAMASSVFARGVPAP